MKLPDFKELHDAQLTTISVDWAQKKVLMRIRHGWPSRWSDLAITGLRQTSMTTLDQWGPSIHILRINIEPVENAIRLLLEMQSGDMVDIVAESAELQAAEVQ